MPHLIQGGIVESNGTPQDDKTLTEREVLRNRKILREREVHERTSLSRTTRWRMEQEGKFPLRRQISERRVGWLESEIDDWVLARKIA